MCYGGVTLGGLADNSARVDYLVGKGRVRAGIGLFCNAKSPITQYEVQNWGTIAGVNQHIAYGGNTAGHNDASHYPADFNNVHATVTTLIISADPFFQDTKDNDRGLIDAANGWIANAPPGTNRYVCYPFDDYANTNGVHRPTAGTASWYGPDLSDAYELLGTSAADALTATSPLPVANTADTYGDF
jgi:hypothetical protein